MNISPSAIKLIEAIEEYKKESGKIEYRFEFEEEQRLLRELRILYNHIYNLQEYEDRRKITEECNKNNIEEL